MKRCSKCREEKPASEFFKQKESSDGLYSYCKPCNAIAQRQKREGNAALAVKERNYMLKTKYGISEEKYLEMVSAQNGVCAICFKPDGGRRLAVDHCHATGAVRGLLCGNCNWAIGLFMDKTESLLSAVRYLSGANKCLN